MKKTISLVFVVAFIVGLIPGVTKAKLVACVGNSNTYGAGLPDRLQNCYPAQLERLLRQLDPHWETRNFGVNGATVLRQGDNSYARTGAYSQALASEPDVVIFCFGPNGSRSPNRGLIQQFYVSDYISLIDAFAELPNKPKMWICYPLKAFSTNYTISNVIIRDQIIPLITQIASEKGLPVIDFYTMFEDSPHLYLSDGIHPNPSGTKLMAEIVAAFITGVRAIPDLDSDGIVNSADICLMVDHWYTDEPAYDIAPPPFGDGIVNVQDLIALAEYLLTYPGALAYWKLDETEGDIAQDSVGDNDAYLTGDPVWQPESGIVDGALQFDGIDDYVSTPFIPDPAKESLSAFAWIRGGAPDQAVLSQAGGVNWLCTDSLEGNLMTELKGTGRGAAILLSQSVITDGNWHRIGLVWDGSHRTLYVDGVAVAEDEQTNLEGSYNGLYIGTGKTMEPGSFWSGLIDDVRIYNRAVSP